VQTSRFTNVFRLIFNIVCGFALVAALLLGTGESWPRGDFFSLLAYLLFIVAAFAQLLMTVLALPTAALVFALVPYGSEYAANPYTNILLSWGALFVAGWVQWAIIVPGLCAIIDHWKAVARRAA
jgi:hypothetical protein